jgi:Uma2 family endonuclease
MSATAATRVSVEEYGQTSYHPDCDYVDGHLEERNVGKKRHSYAQGEAHFWFKLNGKGRVEPFVEQRVRITSTRYRVPDFLLMAAQSPDVDVFDNPYLCLEVMSPDDSAANLQDRLEDYHLIGVPNIWIIDPWKRRAWTFEAGGWYPVAIDAEFRTKDGHFAMPVRTLLLD